MHPTHIGIGVIEVAPETISAFDRNNQPLAGHLCQVLTNAPRGYLRTYVMVKPRVWTGPHIVKAELVALG